MPEGYRVGVLICYDCNLIENVRITALLGAEILIAPHQTGAVRSNNPHLIETWKAEDAMVMAELDASLLALKFPSCNHASTSAGSGITFGTARH